MSSDRLEKINLISPPVYVTKSQSLAVLSWNDNSDFHSTHDKGSHDAGLLTLLVIIRCISRLVYLFTIAFLNNVSVS